MPHKGRIYKRWFRLDASWDLAFGNLMLPEAFFIPFHTSIFSSKYAVSQIGKVMAVNLHRDYVRTWESPVFGGFFDNVYWTFELLGPPDQYVQRTRFSIWHDAIIDTPLYDATYFEPLANREWGLWTLRNVETLHWLSPDITVNPYPLQLTIQAARYDRYNP